MKVICAGAAKTGTKSMARALRILGYETVFDIEEAIQFAFCEWEDLWNGKRNNLNNILDVYSNVDAVVDLPHAYFFDEFLERWPKSKVILMTRNPDEWFESYQHMVSKAMKRYAVLWIFYYLSPSLRRLLKWYTRLSSRTMGTAVPHEILYKTWFKRHNAYVRSTVPPEQLLEFSVKEGWEPLCKFLGKDVPDVPFPVENQRQERHNITDRMMRDTWIAKQMMFEVKLITFVLAVLVVFVLIYVFT